MIIQTQFNKTVEVPLSTLDIAYFREFYVVYGISNNKKIFIGKFHTKEIAKYIIKDLKTYIELEPYVIPDPLDVELLKKLGYSMEKVLYLKTPQGNRVPIKQAKYVFNKEENPNVNQEQE